MWKEPFDFVHSSNLGQGIRNWPVYLKRIYDNLSPGGVLECHESRMAFESDDDTVPKGGYIEQYIDALAKAMKLAGFEDVPPKLEGYLKDAGFVDVKVIIKKLPIGGWPKDPKKKVCSENYCLRANNA